MGKKSKEEEGEETSDQKSQPPRKRGRPRKNIIEKTQTDGDSGDSSESKKALKTTHEEEMDKGIELSSFSGGADHAVEDGEDKKKKKNKEKETMKRKGRRKGQPRKST